MITWIKRSLLLLSLLFLTLILPAHEFWLQPEKFICERGETINIRFKTGENFEGENWSGDASRINTLRLYLKNAKDDLAEQVTGTGDSLELAMFDEGTAMVTFNSNNAYSGKELSQRSVKTLIQVGTKTNDCFKQTTDLPLDIIAQNNPYLLKNNQPLVIKVLFNKKPLVDYDIHLWHRLHDTTLQQIIKTDHKGEIHFNVNTKGKWMVSTVKMNPLTNNPNAEWQSYWGSLTWGY